LSVTIQLKGYTMKLTLLSLATIVAMSASAGSALAAQPTTTHTQPSQMTMVDANDIVNHRLPWSGTIIVLGYDKASDSWITTRAK
jgi:hypothetical protein